MAHLRFGASRPDRRSARALRTPADLFKRLGRGLLWLLAIVLLARGLASLLATDGAASPTVVKPLAHTTAAWPDEEARAFAADFARAYLTAPEPPLERYVTPDLAPSIAADFDDAHSRQDVGAVSVARVAPLGPSQALITVAAAVGSDTRYLAVPVARDAGGGLVVPDLPSLVGPPARAVVEAPSHDPIDSSERPAIEDVLKRFLTAYLAGDAAWARVPRPSRHEDLARRPALRAGRHHVPAARGAAQGARADRVDECSGAGRAVSRDLWAQVPPAARPRRPLVRGGGHRGMT